MITKEQALTCKQFKQIRSYTNPYGSLDASNTGTTDSLTLGDIALLKADLQQLLNVSHVDVTEWFNLRMLSF